MKLGDCSMVSITACAPARKALFGLEDRLVSRDLFRVERPAEGSPAECTDELRPARSIVIGRWLAGDQASRIAPAERVRGESFGRPAVGVG